MSFSWFHPLRSKNKNSLHLTMASIIPGSLKIAGSFRLHRRLSELLIEFIHTLPP